MVQTGAENAEYKERLIANVKKEVKQLMEEAVTKKYVHEESSSVTSLCGAVEACLSHGLRRRALGLFKTSSTTALLHKIGKSCPEAEHISKLVQDIETNDPNKRSSSSSDSFNRTQMLKKCAGSLQWYLWIRLALYEKRLTKIIEYLVANACNYYDRDSLVADPDCGSILSSLLVGPCALEFTRAKTADHYWTDPHADELVQRHRISSVRRSSSTCSRPPIINFKRSLNTSSDEASNCSFKSIASATVAKDYVESLHQNSKATLLYGKNNVQVLPKDVTEPMPGYLSLHQHIQTLTIKWTPNQLMNGYNETEEEDFDKDTYWAYALNINVDEIVYVHCHQSRGEDSGGTIILVGQDGVQRPPIHFPEGGHMQQFLSCLETGLLPHGQLDPPLWSQRGIGKIFPWPKSMRRRILPSVMESMDASETLETPIDYVFRIVSKSKHEEFAATHSILDFVRSAPRRAQLSSCSTTGSSDCSTKSLSMDQYPLESPLRQPTQNTSIEMVCSSMRRQIISRAFYGWLAYCRHLSTVRTHLSGLVHGRITPEMRSDEEGLTKERWEKLTACGTVSDPTEFYRLIYFGGIHPELRKEVWPYLLGHYNFEDTAAERVKQSDQCKHYYETTMSEWLAVEAIVQQREREKTAIAMANLSSGSNSGNERTVLAMDHESGELDNEVFRNLSDSDSVDLESDDEQSRQRHTISSSHLCVRPIPRAMKTSTDSGHVEGALDELDESGNSENEPDDVSSAPADRQVGDIFVAPKLASAIDAGVDAEIQATGAEPSSSSTSSYETVGGQIDDEKPSTSASVRARMGTQEPLSVHSPEYYSADDLQAQLSDAINEEEAEDAVEDMPTPTDVSNNGSNDGDGQVVCKQWSPLTHEGSLTIAETAGSLKLPLGENWSSQGPNDVDDVSDESLPSCSSTPETHGPALQAAVLITNASIDIVNGEPRPILGCSDIFLMQDPLDTERNSLQQPQSANASPASSNGGVYTTELLDKFGLNLHRIEKDVQRCDRNYWYFANENLDKLRNIICTYVWQNLDIGYMQGMCDLLAPLLVIFDDEVLSYNCFVKLMERMITNFPNGGAMDMHFANMRSLIQILDSEMYDIVDSNGDYSHLYFCYRWFLLDFKREFVYDDVFATWENIWAAKHIASGHFELFLALALLETYRDIILSNSMDFTDVIKFFNEMAERHNAQAVLQLARSLVLQLQMIIENN